MKKFNNILWTIVFFILIAGVPISYKFTAQYFENSHEEAVKAAYTYFDEKGKFINTAEGWEEEEKTEKPVIAASSYKTFAKNFDDYFSQAMPYRTELIEFHNKLYYNFGESGDKSVIIGDDDWLFYQPEMETSRAQFLFTEDELKQIAHNQQTIANVMASQGIDYALMISPNKASVYGDELPEDYPMAESQTATDQLVDYLRENTTVNVIFPKEELKAARNKYSNMELYHKLDTHWNHAGGYIASQELGKALGQNTLPDLDSLKKKTYHYSNCDLSNMMGISIDDASTDYYLTGYGQENIDIKSWDYLTLLEYHNNAGAGKGRLFMARDSFGSAMAPFIATYFEDSYFYFHLMYANQTIFSYNPDTYIYELVERDLKDLLTEQISMISIGFELGEDGTRYMVFTPTLSNIQQGDLIVFKSPVGKNGYDRIQDRIEFTDVVKVPLPEGENGTLQITLYEHGSQTKIIERLEMIY